MQGNSFLDHSFVMLCTIPTQYRTNMSRAMVATHDYWFNVSYRPHATNMLEEDSYFNDMNILLT